MLVSYRFSYSNVFVATFRPDLKNCLQATFFNTIELPEEYSPTQPFVGSSRKERCVKTLRTKNGCEGD